MHRSKYLFMLYDFRPKPFPPSRAPFRPHLDFHREFRGLLSSEQKSRGARRGRGSILAEAPVSAVTERGRLIMALGHEAANAY